MLEWDMAAVPAAPAAAVLNLRLRPVEEAEHPDRAIKAAVMGAMAMRVAAVITVPAA
jgi:hypothetical protein